MSLEVVSLAFSCVCWRGEVSEALGKNEPGGGLPGLLPLLPAGAGEALGKRLEVAGAWRLQARLQTRGAGPSCAGAGDRLLLGESCVRIWGMTRLREVLGNELELCL
jgi:hypothetical protein